jgi:hypothetical protein
MCVLSSIGWQLHNNLTFQIYIKLLQQTFFAHKYPWKKTLSQDRIYEIKVLTSLIPLIKKILNNLIISKCHF